MLQTLEISGYRGFESYQLTKLVRVNLVVGKNNCGKTSVLEAIELLVSGGRPAAFLRSLRRRGEIGVRQRDMTPDVSHIFYGHTCVPGAGFKLSSNNGKRALTVKILSLEEIQGADDLDPITKEWAEMGLFEPIEGPTEESSPLFGMSIVRDKSNKRVVMPVMEDGTLQDARRQRPWYSSKGGTPIHFLTLDSFDPPAMEEMWNTVLAEGREGEIVDDMKLLEPKLDSIHFLSSRRYRSDILVGLHGRGPRLPIGTYGDGMRRLLALRLSFVGTAKGVLLIDEIDTGLHWTVMEEMWQFVVEVAQKLDVQVFATTHSYDCIRGLGSLLQSQPELTDQVAIQKVDRSLPQAVCVRGNQIPVAVEQDIEVR